jgi:hypothetical protein
MRDLFEGLKSEGHSVIRELVTTHAQERLARDQSRRGRTGEGSP